MGSFPLTLSELAAMKKNTLPNGGGTYMSPVAPVEGAYGSPTYVSPTVPIKSMFGENAAKTADLARPAPAIFKKTGSTGTGNGGAPIVPPAPAPLDYSKYINPATGVAYTPAEYADVVAKRAGGGTIPGYAGDSITQGPQSAEELAKKARELNNSRNDIATGASDPYKVASKSGIQYSPAELAAIEKAYAGVYDPAINDVFNKLDTKQKQDAADQAAKIKATEDEANFKRDLQKIVFNTNENIRQWRATTGTKAGTGGDFTPTQEHQGAASAGLPISEFTTLDPDIKNFFISKPTTTDETGKSVTQLKVFQDLFDQIKSGDATAADVSDMITNSATLPEAVKHYFIEQLPLDAPTKQGYFSKIWSAIIGG